MRATKTRASVLNRSIDKKPALIVQPTGVSDVQSAVSFARERELLVAVKCGGHSYGGKSTCDGGLLVDLSACAACGSIPRRESPTWRAAACSGRLITRRWRSVS